MATVTGITAARANEILGLSVTSAELDEDGSLVMTRDNGSSFEAGDFLTVVQALVQGAVLNQAYPVGSVYMATVPTNPATLLGGGTWAAWGTGRVPVGVDPAQSEFNGVEETGGAKSVTLTSDQMPAHTHTQAPHNHVQNSHSHSISHDHSAVTSGSAGAHNHTLYSRGGFTENSLGSFPRIKRSSEDASPSYQSSDLMEDGSGAHTHSVNIGAYSGSSGGATAVNNPATATNNETGGGQSHNNLQPYITCYMWKRTG